MTLKSYCGRVCLVLELCKRRLELEVTEEGKESDTEVHYCTVIPHWSRTGFR
jgi:hypothetical protein